MRLEEPGFGVTGAPRLMRFTLLERLGESFVGEKCDHYTMKDV
jgi:hypothetical protein